MKAVVVEQIRTTLGGYPSLLKPQFHRENALEKNKIMFFLFFGWTHGFSNHLISYLAGYSCCGKRSWATEWPRWSEGRTLPCSRVFDSKFPVLHSMYGPRKSHQTDEWSDSVNTPLLLPLAGSTQSFWKSWKCLMSRWLALLTFQGGKHKKPPDPRR